jgi:hypothetical protein
MLINATAAAPDLTENSGTSRDHPTLPVSNTTNLPNPTTEFPPPPETASSVPDEYPKPEAFSKRVKNGQ